MNDGKVFDWGVSLKFTVRNHKLAHAIGDTHLFATVPGRTFAANDQILQEHGISFGDGNNQSVNAA